MARRWSALSLGFIFVQILYASATCNWQYFKHYEQKDCKAVLGANGCPLRFRCKELSQEDLKSCIHNGKTYRDGEDIKETGPCRYCYCSVQESANIVCSFADCFSWGPRNKTCHIGYKPNHCCPVEICPNQREKLKTCSYKGKEYKIGDVIQIPNPCKSCLCTEKWTDENGPGCWTVKCLNGLYARQIRRGCLPIYREDSCCITEMYCGRVHGSNSVILTTENKEQYCQYKGFYYRTGSTLFLDTDQHHCISCKCTIPPDFTCLRKKCPSKPRDNCKEVYGHCCPDYECP